MVYAIIMLFVLGFMAGVVVALRVKEHEIKNKIKELKNNENENENAIKVLSTFLDFDEDYI